MQKKLGAAGIDKMFLSFYPQALASPGWLDVEKKHKKASDKVLKLAAEHLQLHNFENALQGSNADILQHATAMVSISTTVSTFEKIAFRNFINTRSVQQDFIEGLKNFLYNYNEESFEQFIYTLSKVRHEVNNSNAAKWTIATLFLVAHNPNKFSFMKPTTAKNIAQLMGANISYNSYPNIHTYTLFNDIINKYKNETTIAGVDNNIIAQAIIYMIIYNIQC